MPPSEYFLVWDKAQTVPSFAECEYAHSTFPIPAKVFRYSIHLHNHSAKYHPTQKPVPLFQWCLSLASQPGDLILDPFAGSGTTALACHALGRRFICIEREPEYVEVARQRLRDAQAQGDLFRESVGTAPNTGSAPCYQVEMEL
jgi:DNA modification methylase